MKAERQKKIDEQLEKKNNCCQVVLNVLLHGILRPRYRILAILDYVFCVLCQ